MKRLLLLTMVSCGAPNEDVRVVKIEASMSLTQAQKDKCPRLPQFKDRIKAKLIVEGKESTPCQLTVSTADGAPDTLAVKGECPGIPVGSRPLFRLMWYTVSPTAGKEIELAESLGRAPLENPEQEIVDVEFDPVKQTNLKPKTKAGATETTATKDTFNCDRTGTNVCDSTSPAPPSPGNDVDTCSNLEELCQDTLFTNSVDQCPPGPRTTR